MKKSFKKIVVAATSFVALGGVFQTAVLAQEDGVIATVGDKEITQEEFYQELKAIAGDVTLRTLILEMVLENSVPDAATLRTAAEEEVQAQIDEAGGQEVFDQLLAYQQLGSAEEFTEQIYLRNLFQSVIEQNTDMSDEAIQNYYDNEYSPTMEAQHILVETEEEAYDVIERINNGEEFDAVAQEVSLDSSASNGGLLGEFTTGQMVPEFEEAVVSQENGEMTQEPVESNFGFHVIRTINNGSKAPLEEVREEVELQYINSRLEDSAYAFGIIGRLVQEANVQINDEDLTHAIDDLIALAAPAEGEAETEESTDAEESAATEESATEETVEEESTEDAE